MNTIKIPEVEPFPYSAELQTAIAAAQAGGEIVQRFFHDGVEMDEKGSNNLVSEADIQSEKAIVQCIHDRFPEHQVLGEEEAKGDADAEHVWIVDPLDGTNNFGHRIEHFAVSIAYWKNGKPQCGVVLEPIKQDWYVCQLGCGAWRNGHQVHVSRSKNLSQAMIGLGFYYNRDQRMEATLNVMRELFQNHIHGVRRFGTASLDLCNVGCGTFDAFFEFELAPWDFAAGVLFVTEAGGQVTTCNGDPVSVQSSPVLASNGHLHDLMLQITTKYHPKNC